MRPMNAAQVKELEAGLTERVTQQEQDLKTRSDYQFQFAQAIASAAANEHADARAAFRSALKRYKSGKPRQLIEKKAGVIAALNIFVTLRRQDEANRLENARSELADEL